MRIPPYYRKPSFQRFFSGVMIGALISWFIFLYMFGHMQERQAKIITQQKDTITSLNKDKKIWQEEFKELNKQKEKVLTVQEIKVKIVNYEKYKLDTLSVYEAEESVKEDLSMVMAKDLESVFKSRDILRKAIENKTIKLNEKRYKLDVKEIYIYTTLTVQLNIRYDD